MSANVRRTFSGRLSGVNMEGRYILSTGATGTYSERAELIIRDIETDEMYLSYTHFDIEFKVRYNDYFHGFLASRDYINNIIYAVSISDDYWGINTLIFQNGSMEMLSGVFKLCTHDGRLITIEDENLLIDGSIIMNINSNELSEFQCVGNTIVCTTPYSYKSYVINLNDNSVKIIESYRDIYENIEDSGRRSYYLL